MKAADIPDKKAMMAIELAIRLKSKKLAAQGREYGTSWANIWDIYELLSEYPWRVVRAKLNNLIKKGLVTGCTCGCRGDFEYTEKGWSLMEPEKESQ